MRDPEQIVRAIDPRARLLRTWALRGGISSSMIALEIALSDGATRRLIVRRPSGWAVQRNPCGASDEFRLLQHLQIAGLPTPLPVYIDESASEPFFVVEYIDGAPDFAPADLSGTIAQLASHLAAIHRVEGVATELAFLQLHPRHRPEPLVLPPGADKTLGVARICEALATACPLPAKNGIALLHGDYWPGNVLWKNAVLVGVIDWEDSQIGDPLADLAISRLDVLWAYGEGAMHELTACYQRIANVDLTDLAYWDLDAALRPVFNIAQWASGWRELGRPDVTEATLRAGHAQFVGQALDALSA